ncbi:MAG: hypothetical protein K0M78_09725 [Brevundimonas sp.]|nr:hypothetical protein [Brevundimonas sp.]
MTSTPPRDEPVFRSGGQDDGKVAAVLAWGLYILSIPSANVLVLVGLIVAYAGRSSATGLALEHLNAQIRLFWSVFWWTIACWLAIGVSALLSVILIGIPFLFIFLLAWFLISVWFTVKSIFGLINLLGDRAP